MMKSTKKAIGLKGYLHEWKIYILLLSALIFPLSALGSHHGIRELYFLPAIGILLQLSPKHLKAYLQDRSRFFILAAVSLFLLWAIFTCFWDTGTGTPVTALRVALTTFIGFWMIAVFLQFPNGMVNLFVSALVAGMLCANVMIILVCGMERLGLPYELPLAGLDMNFCAVLVTLFLIPVSYFLRKNDHRKTFWTLLLLSIPAVLLSQILAAKLALLSGFLIFIFTCLRARATTILVEAILVLSILFFPLAVKTLPPPEVSIEWKWLPTSSFHRLVIWDFTVEKIRQKPLEGWGFNNARAISYQEEMVHVQRKDGTTESFKGMPAHPHNVILELWLDVGGIGVFLFLLILLGVFRKISKAHLPVTATSSIMATLWAFSLISAVSYNFWATKWQLILWLLVVLCCRIFNDARSSHSSG